MRTDLNLTSRSQEIPQAPKQAKQPSLWQGLEAAGLCQRATKHRQTRCAKLWSSAIAFSPVLDEYPPIVLIICDEITNHTHPS